MEVALQMVGHYQYRDVKIKDVQFINGRTMVRGADELVGNICKYLTDFGAFPPHEAEKRQAVLDRAAGRLGDMRGAKARRDKALKDFEDAEAELEISRLAREKMLLQQEEDRANGEAPKTGRGAKVDHLSRRPTLEDQNNGSVETKEAPEGRGSESDGRSGSDESESETSG